MEFLLEFLQELLRSSMEIPPVVPMGVPPRVPIRIPPGASMEILPGVHLEFSMSSNGNFYSNLTWSSNRISPEVSTAIPS